ncbi:MAG: hypothetical protein EAZ27_05930 [Cytophagales bacterium]|nr:MAG: hypothetical protein EAZ27_05930 [Cytophagales bacterium]
MNYYINLIKNSISVLFLIFIFLGCKNTVFKPNTYANKSSKIDSTIVADSAFEAQIMPFRKKLDAIMNRKIGFTKVALTKTEGESLLGNFVSDAILEKARTISTQKVDIGAVNNGGLRSPLPQGSITVGHIFELMPFENELVLVDLTGKQMKQYFEYHIGKKLHLSNTKVRAKGKILVEALIGGIPLDTMKTYTIAMSDYMATSEPPFIKTLQTKKLNIKFRDLLIYYFEEKTAKKDTVNPIISGRLVFE